MTEAAARPLRSSRPTPWRLGASFLIGTAAALAALAFGMPGRGEFVPTLWLAGFVALLIAPGWLGFGALMLGATMAAVLADMSDGIFGLVLLVVVIVGALAGHGALAASVLRRVRTLGWRSALRDEATLLGPRSRPGPSGCSSWPLPSLLAIHPD